MTAAIAAYRAKTHLRSSSSEIATQTMLSSERFILFIN